MFVNILVSENTGKNRQTFSIYSWTLNLEERLPGRHSLLSFELLLH